MKLCSFSSLNVKIVKYYCIFVWFSSGDHNVSYMALFRRLVVCLLQARPLRVVHGFVSQTSNVSASGPVVVSYMALFRRLVMCLLQARQSCPTWLCFADW